IVCGAAVDLALGLVLLRSAAAVVPRERWMMAAGVSALATALAAAGVRFDPNRLASGVFRPTQTVAAARGEKLLFYKDGKTSTVSVLLNSAKVMSIRTNGKSDAAIDVSGGGSHRLDESTMVLTGVLPLLLHPEARSVANVGIGSGLTTHALLTHSGVAHLDTIEIEAAMVEG